MKKKILLSILSFSLLSGLFFAPTQAVLAQDQAVPAPELTEQTVDISKIEPCVFNDENGTLEGCLLRSFFWLIYYFSAWVTETAAAILDFFIAYSIDSSSYAGNNNTFVMRGWAVIRDIANVLFIFTILYIAIRHILQLGGSDTKKLLKSLIIAALLINFSLFFTKVIIDAGNVLARVFYNNIEVTNDDGVGGKKISQAIAEHVQPQKLLSADFLEPRPAPGQLPGTLNSGYIFFILCLTAFVNFTVAITFISVFLFFIARVIGLWFMMIFSPLAFVSIAVPSSGKMFGDFGWDGWLGQTLKLSFMAPIFMFFLFLLTMFLQIVATTPPPDASVTQKLTSILIPFLVVIVVLNVAKSQAKDMSGKFGENIKSAAAKLSGAALGFAGVAGGMALSATAWTARNTIGRAASKSINSSQYQNKVRLAELKAQDSLDKARSAKTDDERMAFLKEAAGHRRTADINARKVKMADNFRKGSWDIRRNEFLKNNVTGSAIGKKLIGSGGLMQVLGNEMTGEKLKFDLGKGKDTSRMKYEEEMNKKQLETAKLYEKQPLEDLAVMSYSAEKGLAGQAELVERMTKYIDEAKKKDDLPESEKKKLEEIEYLRDMAALAKSDQEIKNIKYGEKDKDGKYITKGLEQYMQVESAQKRNAYAYVKEGDVVFNVQTGADNALHIADKIRKGPKGPLDKTLKDLLDENNPKPPPAAPPPPPPPPPTP